MNIFEKLLTHHGQVLHFNFFLRFSKTNKSTSIHTLNADRGLKRRVKILHFILNKLNNLFPNYKIDKSLEVRNFKEENLKKNWLKCSITSSPGTKIADLFWINLPWNLIKKELNEINILDIGCGEGNYGHKFVDYSNNNINRYVGLDIKRYNNWIKLKKKYSFFQFYKFSGKNFTNLIPHETNLFITQTAIEHFEEDLTFFNQISDYISSSRRNIIQIHIFPARASLSLMPFHGVRQYTPRTVSKIISIFKDFSYTILFNLGGKYCNYLHYKYITEPRRNKLGDMRFKKTQEYNKLSFNAIIKDMEYPQKSPLGYALVIHSNWKNKIF